MIEFCSKKGQHNHTNQDNFFCIVDGNTKIFGMFDGHGTNGERVSAYAMGHMLDYVKNASWFKDVNSSTTSPEAVQDEKMKKGIKCCFKYVQDKLRDQYCDFLVDNKKKKMARDRYDQQEKLRRNHVKAMRDIQNQFKQKSSTSNEKEKKVYRDKRVNNIFDDEEDKRLERDQFIKSEYSIINSNEVSIDEDDQDFIDNYSWDTKSENDQDLVDYLCEYEDEEIFKYYNQ